MFHKGQSLSCTPLRQSPLPLIAQIVEIRLHLEDGWVKITVNDRAEQKPLDISSPVFLHVGLPKGGHLPAECLGVELYQRHSGPMPLMPLYGITPTSMVNTSRETIAAQLVDLPLAEAVEVVAHAAGQRPELKEALSDLFSGWHAERILRAATAEFLYGPQG